MPALNDKHYVTPQGFAALKTELHQLNKVERPKLVETVRWAAGNGDRSENGDYIYGKKRLREIDRRMRYLIKRIEHATVVDSSQIADHHRVYFGAIVSYQLEDDTNHRIQIVGVDEADPAQNKISYISPLAKQLLQKQVGDVVKCITPASIQSITILEINYLPTE